jgi:hypothetical protein
MFSPVIERWMRADPAGYLDGMNPYRSFADSPIEGVDPWGLKDYKEGTGDPVYTPDAGAGAWGSVSATWKERGLKDGIKAGLLAYFGKKYPHAADMLNHYFSNTGYDKVIPLDAMIREVPSAKSNFRGELAEAQRFAQTLDAGHHEITSQQFSSGYDTKAENADWFYAIGGYAYWGRGTLDVTCLGGGVKEYHLDFEYKMRDRYNWDSGKSVTISIPVWGTVKVNDSFMGEFHREGYAKEYDVYGSYHQKIAWRSDGSAVPPPPPPPPSGGRSSGR